MGSRKFRTPKYPIAIFWSEPEKICFAQVPDLPGCLADGATYQEALAGAEVVIREWIDTAHELGRAIPRPSRRVALN